MLPGFITTLLPRLLPLAAASTTVSPPSSSQAHSTTQEGLWYHTGPASSSRTPATIWLEAPKGAEVVVSTAADTGGAAVMMTGGEINTD